MGAHCAWAAEKLRAWRSGLDLSGPEARHEVADQTDQVAGRATQNGHEEAAGVKGLHQRCDPRNAAAFADRIEHIVKDGKDNEAEERQAEKEEGSPRLAPVVGEGQNETGDRPLDEQQAQRVIGDPHEQAPGQGQAAEYEKRKHQRMGLSLFFF